MISVSTLLTVVLACLTYYKQFGSGHTIDFSIFVLLVYLTPVVELAIDYGIKRSVKHSQQWRMLNAVSIVYFGFNTVLFALVVLMHEDNPVTIVAMSLAAVLGTSMMVFLIDQLNESPPAKGKSSV